MMRSIFKSFRTELIVYSFLSMGLALLTELLLVIGLCSVSRLLGVSYTGYGRKPKITPRPNYRDSLPGKEWFDYHQFRHFDRNTIISILLIVIVGAVFLFIVYFLLFMKRIVRDMSYISDSINHIATGDMTEKLEVNRRDELGEIAKSVNEMAEQLQKLMMSEREAVQMNRELITCVAHDLRTPVTSIMGYLELAMDMEHHDLMERQKYARIALQKANRLEGLIQDLFSYTKLMSGEITLHRSQIDLVQLVEQMVEEFYPIFQDNHLECEFSVNINHLEMTLDGEMIARAIQNLLSNAVKYGKDGKQVFVQLEILEQEVQVRVTNFGLVIPEESLEHLFDKFYRVEESRSAQTGGTGLGLNIAQEIVHLHGGRIQVESGIQGTVFTIALPWEETKSLQNKEGEHGEERE